MPSRTGMLIMASRRGGRGDPFFGAIARLATRGVGALIRRVRGGGIAKSASGAIAKIGIPGGRLSRVGRAAAGAAGLGGAFELGSRAIGVLTDGNGEPIKKRRGINPLNPRAARRAVSRLCRLQHFTDRLEHSLSDLVKRKHHGHHHHRR